MIFLASIFCLQNCTIDSRCDLHEVLQTVQRDLYYLPTSDWTVRQEIVFDDSAFKYDLTNFQGDTSYNLRIDLFCSEHNRPLEFDYKITWFEKIYFDDQNQYNLIMKSDTVMFYKTPLGLNSKKEFLIGKYYYMLTYPDEYVDMGYTEKHFIYIHNNFDSLKRIRGDSLVFPFSKY